MLRLIKLVCALCLFWSVQTPAQAQLKGGEIRG